MNLTEFLRARIAEDEAWAAALAGERWDYGKDQGNPSGPKRGLYTLGGERHLSDLWDANAARHIARHDPARVLAECESKRGMVAAAQAYSPELSDGDNGEWALDLMCRHLALPYADHPDYDEAWRP